MNDRTIFLKCLCGRNKTLAAKFQKEGYKVKVTSKNVEWRREAASYKAKLPFKVVDGEVTEL